MTAEALVGVVTLSDRRLITRRSQIQILPPLLKSALFSGAFLVRANSGVAGGRGSIPGFAHLRLTFPCVGSSVLGKRVLHRLVERKRLSRPGRVGDVSCIAVVYERPDGQWRPFLLGLGRSP